MTANQKRWAMTHDPKIWALASAFLDDHPHIHTTDNFNELADKIQRTIDEFIADKLRNYDGAPKS